MPSKPKQVAVSSCQLCSANDSADNMVACDKCDLWYHFECAGVDVGIQNQEYVCRRCMASKNHSTPTLLEPPPQSTNQVTPTTSHQLTATTEAPHSIMRCNEPHASTSYVDSARKHFERSAPLSQPNVSQRQQVCAETQSAHHANIQMCTKQSNNAANSSNKPRSISATSKGSRRSSATRLGLELQKLDEERRIEELRQEEESALRRKRDKEYLNKKYQILDKFAEESSCSDDDISTNKNGKVEEWIMQTRNSTQMCKEGKKQAEPVLLNPIYHATDVTTTWLGANVIPTQQQQLKQQPQSFQNTCQQPIPTQPTKIQSSTIPQEFISELPHNQHPPSNNNITYLNGEFTNRQFTDPRHMRSNTNIDPTQLVQSQHRERVNFQQPQPIHNQVQLGAAQELTRSHLAARQSVLKELPIFNGNPEDWPLFISSFERTTQLCGFSDEENLVRLQRVLKDQALASVQSLLYLPSCVPRVISTLKMMFGRPELILNSLYQKIQATPSPKVDKLETLVNFAIAVQNLCATLETSGMVSHLNNPMLLQELIEKLPSSIRLNWALYRQTLLTCTLSEFSIWLYQLAEAANCVIVPSSSAGKLQPHGKKEKGFLHAHSSMSVPMEPERSAVSNEHKCFVCSKSCASIDKCAKFSQLCHSSKWGVVREHKLCRRCLTRHANARCQSEAVCGKNGCTYKHHNLLHNEQNDCKRVPELRVPTNTIAQPNNTHTDSTNTVLFRIVPVILHGHNVQVRTYAFLDDGSSLTLMDEEIADLLNVEGRHEPLCLRWTANAHRYEDESKVLNFHISGIDLDSRKYPLTDVHTVKQLQLPQQTINVKKLQSQYSHLRNLPINSYSDATPRLLIGLNNWNLGLPRKCKEGELDQPVAAKTRLGWTIHGYFRRSERQAHLTATAYTNFHMCECNQGNDSDLELLVKEFLCTEDFGTTNSTDILRSSDDQRAMELLQSLTKRKGGQFETGLLWKYDKIDLPDSFAMAKRRLVCLQQRMQRDPELSKELHEKILSYIEKGYARKLSQNEVTRGRKQSWYLPIFPVRNPNKPGKVRLVWDAAAKVGGVCLNSVLLKGPDLLTPLTAVIFKFRERRFAICADIQEMFHQIRIREQDQQYQRFLWCNQSNNKLEEYVMMVMTFGATCSPSCAQYIKNKNAEEFEDEFPRAVRSIHQNHYVDDLMDSVDSEQQAIQLAKEITYIHQQGGFHIRNWISNSKVVIEALQSVPTDELNLNTKAELETEKVLGMWWRIRDDYFTFRISSNSKNKDVLMGTKIPTKREVLRILMKIFDPLGLLANYLMYVKVLLQEVWRSGIGWDDPIQEAQHKKWIHWTRFLSQLDEIQIPRCYISNNFENYPEMQLHVFVDASENGFAAVAYARSSSDGLVECSLIGAKTKVAPLKTLSIPRLELQAAVLGVRLAARWKDSILSIPKKWLSTSEATDEFGFPDALPKVPVPLLDQTMTEYLRALEPIVTPAQLERTKTIIKQFTAPTGLGPRLHQYLQDKREAEDNWVYYYWLNEMYMDIRIPLPINSNPGMVFPPRKFTTVHDVARFAARIIEGIMQHKEMLDTGKLQQERATSREKGQPLCMAQYYRLLGSCRRPGIERDSQYLPQNSADEHIIVVCRNQMYCVVLKASDRGKLSESEIASQILFVLSDAPCLPAKPPPIGLLTAEPRSRWAQDRATILLEERNQRNIELIEKALIVLALDEPLANTFNARGFTGATPSTHFAGSRDETNMAHEMIHGGGSDFNSANRWFDKTMQIIICTDGTWGLCYEHSPSEGIAVVQLLEKIYTNILVMGDADDGVPQHHLPPPERLEWEVAPEIERRLSDAAITVDKAIDNLDFYVYRYKGYGKSFIKSCQVSPDVFIQLSLQLAYYKLYGHLVATYESASTRRFLLGRVDCIRSASIEALEWTKAMCQGEGPNVALESDREEEEDSRKVKFSIYSKDHLRELFRCAVARQTEVMVQNILGSGIDIPLLGLREASREQTGSLHELFNDESYRIANCFLLSTSQVACGTDSFMGYGPVTPRGYGCSYNPRPDEIIFCVSAFYSCEDTSASRYAKSLQDSLEIMRDLLQN